MPDALHLVTHAELAAGRATSSLRTVLIFAHECAPFNRKESTIGAQRPAQFAKWLREFGWRAIVLCCDAAKQGRGWTVRDRDDVMFAMRDADPESSIIIATPSLPSNGVVDRAWKHASRPNARVATALVRRPLTFARFFTGDYSASWQPCARQAAQLIAQQAPVHVCIGEHSPDAGIFLARWFAKRYRLPWIADFRDPMLFGFQPKVRPLLAPAARLMLSSASHVVNVTPRCVELDRALFRRPTTLITNGFDPDDYTGPAPPRSHNEFRIAYTGSLQLPEGLRVFMKGLAKLRERVGHARFGHVRFMYRGNASALARRVAEDVGVAMALDAGEHLPRAEVIALIRSAHLLLVLSTPEMSKRDPYWAQGVYPGKTFEYIGAQRPILCVPGDGAMLDALLKETNLGTSLYTAEQVATHLEDQLCKWERTGDIPALENSEAASRFSRREGARLLSEILDHVCRR